MKYACLNTFSIKESRVGILLATLVLVCTVLVTSVTGSSIINSVNNCSTRTELRSLISWVRSNSYAEPSLADALAAYLRNGTRWFERGGVHGDAIEQVGSANGYVAFTYHRDGKRWGVAKMSAHRVGGYVVLVGDWWQASKMRGKSTTVPPIPGLPSFGISIPWGMAFKDDHGGNIYVFKETRNGFRSVSGTGCDYGDKRTNPNWVTGGGEVSSHSRATNRSTKNKLSAGERNAKW